MKMISQAPICNTKSLKSEQKSVYFVLQVCDHVSTYIENLKHVARTVALHVSDYVVLVHMFFARVEAPFFSEAKVSTKSERDVAKLRFATVNIRFVLVAACSHVAYIGRSYCDPYYVVCDTGAECMRRSTISER